MIRWPEIKDAPDWLCEGVQVRLKMTGAPAMIVTRRVVDSFKVCAKCAWFENGTMREAVFFPEAIEPA